MKILLTVALAILMTSIFTWPVLLAADNEVEDKIWALEEEYISAFKSADHDKILDFYHQDFLGWPDSQAQPAGKSEAKNFLKKHYPQPISGSFEIDRAGIRVFGNVVMTQYILNVSMRDENGVEHTTATRITHTWLKEGTRWWILGGMSNQQKNKN
jgi:ketosteroid isomerase-like protein